MTKEKEAIKQLKKLKSFHNGSYGEAINVAIKVLEQEPCEDAISRQAVLECIEGSEAELGHSSENELVCQYIKGLPSVTPQPKIGHWIFVDKAKEHALCSECDCGAVDLFDGRWHNYCENCGAKMEVEE